MKASRVKCHLIFKSHHIRIEQKNASRYGCGSIYSLWLQSRFWTGRLPV